MKTIAELQLSVQTTKLPGPFQAHRGQGKMPARLRNGSQDRTASQREAEGNKPPARLTVHHLAGP